MGLSLSMHGYLVARGRAGTRENPKSKWNKNSIERIINFANKLNAVPLDLLRSGFMIDNQPISNKVSVLNEVWFDVDFFYRTGFFAMFDYVKMHTEGEVTLLVDSLDVFDAKTPEDVHFDEDVWGERNPIYQTLREIYEAIGATRSSIVSLSDDCCLEFMKKDALAVTFGDLERIIMKGIENRMKIARKLEAIRSLELPRNTLRSQYGYTPLYSIKGERGYRPVLCTT